MSVQILYINMDKRTDRRQRMEEELRRVSLPWSRREGVECNFQDITSLFHKGVIPSVECYAQCLVNPGNLGCYLSHVAVLEEIAAADPQDVFIVLEDDVRIVVDDFEDRIHRILRCSPQFDMVYLYIPPHRLFVESFHSMCYRMKYGYEGLYAYMIQPAYARVLLSQLGTFHLPVDHQVMQCNEDRESVILTPVRPLVWTDCSPRRDSDTLRQKRLSLPLPVHTARGLSPLETNLLGRFHIQTYPTWSEAYQGMEEKGGILLPHDHHIKRPIHMFLPPCGRLAFGSNHRLSLPFLAGILHHIEDMIQTRDARGQEMQWIDPVLVPYLFSPIDGTHDYNLHT